MPSPTPPIDISALLKEYGAHAANIEFQENEVSDAATKLGQSNDREVSAILTEGSLAASIATDTAQLTLDREKRNQEAAATFGVSMEASNAVIGEMSRNVLRQHYEVQEGNRAILAKQNTRFSDDPVEWIMNAFTLPQDMQAQQTREAILERDTKTLTSLENLTQEQVKTNNAIAATTTTALARANADKAVQAATIRAENARQQALRDNVQFGTVRLAANHMQFEALSQVHNAQVALARLDLERQTKQINEEMKDLQKRNLELIIEKRDQDLASKAAFQVQLDSATAIVGMRRMTTEDYDRAPTQVKAALFEIMSNPNVSAGRLGYDTIDALKTVQAVNAPLTPSLNEVKDRIIKWNAGLMNRHPEWKGLDKDQQHNLLQENAKAQTIAEASNIPDSGGMYSAPPLASLAKIPAVASTIIWKAGFAAQAANPMRPTSAQAFYDTAVDLADKKNMSIERAASEVALIYRAVAMDNTQQKDYNRFALPLQNNYRTTINTGYGPLLGTADARVLDMTNETEIKNSIMRSISARHIQAPPGIGAQ